MPFKTPQKVNVSIQSPLQEAGLSEVDHFKRSGIQVLSIQPLMSHVPNSRQELSIQKMITFSQFCLWAFQDTHPGRTAPSHRYFIVSILTLPFCYFGLACILESKKCVYGLLGQLNRRVYKHYPSPPRLALLDFIYHILCCPHAFILRLKKGFHHGVVYVRANSKFPQNLQGEPRVSSRRF